RANLSNVVRNRQLTELVRDVELDVGPHDLHMGAWDREQVHQVFDTLQFRVLRDRLYQTLSAPEPEADVGFEVEGGLLGPEEVAAWLADTDRPKAGHDIKGPMHALAAHGWTLAGVTSDTALAAYLALPGQRSFDLADLALRYLQRELRAEGADDAQLSLDGSSEADAAQGEIVRARAVAELAEAFDSDLDKRKATKLLRDVELPLLFVLADMERSG